MLRPQDSPTRERKQIVGLWDFCLDPEDEGVDKKWYGGKLPEAVRIAVPASFNDLFTDKAIRYYVGAFWYQTTVKIPKGWEKDRIFLYFESVTHRARVWVNDTEVVFHEGGYTPFEVEVTNQVKHGQFARITVRAENTLSFRSIPVGIIKETPAGEKQFYWHDFFNYAGIHRPVWLYCKPETYIEDIIVETDIEDSAGIAKYEVVQGGKEAGLNVRVNIMDMTGKKVAEGNGEKGIVKIDNVHPWAPGDGYLYFAEFLLYDNLILVDSYTLRVGVRTVKISDSKILINGKPFYFKGFGMHEDIEILGKGHNDAYMIHDFKLLKWIGANSFRTSHYAYSEDVLDYADEQGIVVIDETPAVGLNMINTGIFPGDNFTTFSSETADDTTQALHAQVISELVKRDRNHPSVVIWSIANEPESMSDASVEYFRPLFEIVREMDNTRPVGFANMAFYTHGKCKVTRYADVILLNRYYGWYSETGDLESAAINLRKELEGWAGENKPIIMTEYGADAITGMHAVISEPWTEEYQVDFLRMSHSIFDSIDAVVGEHVWNFADFATAPSTARVEGNKKGIFTRDRKPKAAAFELKRRWSEEK